MESLLQAILIEEVEKSTGHLIDLRSQELSSGSLVYYVGDIRVAVEKEDIGHDLERKTTTAWIEVIQNEANRQEGIIKKEDAQLEILTFYVTLGELCFAVIASSKWIDYGTLASYGFLPIGLLGRLEKTISGVAFIAPFWLWHDGW